MPRALITGIAGFAGSHLAELLVSSGREVCGTVLDDEDLGRLQSVRARVRLIPCRIENRDEIYRAVRETEPDEIYHLAGMAFVIDAWQGPREAFEVNALGAMNLYDAVIRSRLNPWIVSILSADVYGAVAEEEMPLLEERILRPIHPYGLSKAAADLIGYHYFYAFNLPIIRVRPFNHIGPRQSPKFVCSDFAWQIARIEEELQEPVIDVGNLRAIRDFTDVRDTVRAYLALMERGRAGEVYHVSSGHGVSIESILERLLALSKVPIQVRTNPAKMRRSDAPVQRGDSSKLRGETGWIPVIPLEQTLSDLLHYWRAEIAAQKRGRDREN